MLIIIFFKKKSPKNSDKNDGATKEANPDLFKVKKEFLDDEKTSIEEHKGHPEEDITDIDFDFDFGDDEEESQQEAGTPVSARQKPMLRQNTDILEKDPYFSTLYKETVENLKSGNFKIDAKEVLNALNNYYKSNKADEVSEHYSIRLEDQIQESLDELTRHEDEWKELQDLSHQVQSQIAEKEKEIENSVNTFKKLVRKLAFTKKVPEEKYFKLEDGSIIANISGLMAALPHMSDTTFSHHVTAERNDFADWIKHTFDDAELSDAVRKCNSRKELYLELKKAVE